MTDLFVICVISAAPNNVYMYLYDFRLTPYEFLERAATNNQFSMSNSLWFTLGSLLQQSTEHTPR